MLERIQKRIEELNEARAQAQFGPVELGGPARPETIAAVEAALGVRLPDDYRRFLERYGALAIGDEIVCGIWDDSSDNEAGGTILGETRRLRQEHEMPRPLVAIL